MFAYGSRTETLVLNLSMLAWPNSSRETVPRSICSEPCPKGYIRNFQVRPRRTRRERNGLSAQVGRAFQDERQLATANRRTAVQMSNVKAPLGAF